MRDNGIFYDRFGNFNFESENIEDEAKSDEDESEDDCKDSERGWHETGGVNNSVIGKNNEDGEEDDATNIDRPNPHDW